MELPESGFLWTVFSALLSPLIRLFDRASRPAYQERLALNGLEKTVQVKWDSFAVPHVRAAGEADLFLAQGYLHAQERLWQMDMSRRFFSGRVAEIFGDFALASTDLSTYFHGRTCADFDYFIRLLGIRAAAEATVSQLDAPDRLRLQMYCDGINRYIERCGKKLPWEFRLLRYQPDPWRPQDTLTVSKGLSLFLSPALFSRLNYMAIAARLKDEPEKLRALYPGSANHRASITQAVWEQANSLWRFASGIIAASGSHPAGQGSNSWVVAPSRSQSGGALLCNDPHLRMTLPSTWYLMHLKAEETDSQASGYEAWGASVPGLPFIQLGYNRRIAWGMTAAVCDDVEIYRERLHPLEPQLYLTRDRWQKFATRIERMAIRGKRPVERAVRWTRHGPVLSDFEPGHGRRNEVLSLRWTTHEPSQELAGLYALNQARDWMEFRNALRRHGSPSLNCVYADTEGNIGYALAGNIPRRAQAPNLLPVEGWRDENEWQGYVPFDDLPSLYNPPEGVIATANNRIVDAAYPYLSHFFEPPHRFRRIHQLLGRREKFSAGDLAAFQLDTVSLHARELIAALSGDLERLENDDPALKTAVDLLLAWDGNCDASSVAACVFHVFHHRLLSNLLVPTLGEGLFTAYVEILNQCIAPTDAILQNPDSPWFGDRSRYRLVAQSLREACVELSQALGESMASWHWSRIHRLRMNHPLGRIEIFKPLLGIGPLATSGDGMTVNMGFYRHSNPYEQTVGPSLRYIVDLAARENTGFILAAGQSGHALSPHYADQTSLWLRGERIALHAEPQSESPGLGSMLLAPG
jgi:penicillin amidase